MKLTVFTGQKLENEIRKESMFCSVFSVVDVIVSVTFVVVDFVIIIVVLVVVVVIIFVLVVVVILVMSWWLTSLSLSSSLLKLRQLRIGLLLVTSFETIRKEA